MSGFKAYNYTNTWKQEKKLYSIYEYQLPTPIPFTQILVFIAAAAVWIPLMLALGIKPTGAFQIILWVIVPGLAAFFGNRPVWEDKSIISFAKALFRFYFLESKYVLDGNQVTGVNNNLILEDPKIPEKTATDSEVEQIEAENLRIQKKNELKFMQIDTQYWQPDKQKLEAYNLKKLKPIKKPVVNNTKQNTKPKPPSKRNNTH